ncbi:MAG TPA: MFS transporter [Segetibacter sp.]|nr:MFS transporter [Segetibacter sp.]
MKNISNERRQRISTIVAFAIVPMSAFATDIYIPSMPSMGTGLKITSLQVQLTLTAFLISYGIAQLFIGALLDTFGRYKLGLTALFVFAIASITIANTDNIYLIYLMRVIHGLTVATIVVAKRAYFVDVYKGEQLKSYLSIFTIIWSVGPIVAPFIGGYLQTAFGWHSNFYFLAGMAGVIGLLEALFTGETLASPVAFNVRRIAATYYEMITTLRFILGLVILGLAYSTVMIYNLTGPFIIEHKLGLSPVIIGYCSLFLGFAWTIGGLIGKATVEKPFFSKLLLNLLLQLLFAIAMVLSVGFFGSLFTILFFAFIIHAAAGFTFNNYFTFNMTLFPKNAGISGGLIGGVVYVIVSLLTSGIVYILPAKDERNLSYSYLLLITASVLVLYILLRANKRTSPTISDTSKSY